MNITISIDETKEGSLLLNYNDDYKLGFTYPFSRGEFGLIGQRLLLEKIVTNFYEVDNLKKENKMMRDIIQIADQFMKKAEGDQNDMSFSQYQKAKKKFESHNPLEPNLKSGRDGTGPMI